MQEKSKKPAKTAQPPANPAPGVALDVAPAKLSKWQEKFFRYTERKFRTLQTCGLCGWRGYSIMVCDGDRNEKRCPKCVGFDSNNE